MFNSTTHAGELKAYIQFCLAMSAWAITSTDKVIFKNIDHYTPAQKAAIMGAVLTERLGMTGDEFKTARQHLTKNLIKKAEEAA
jgi:ABC-type iron transport system FetAB permease component